MGDGTKIEWTDATVNVINGCSLASPGCTNCYAMRLAGTRMKTHPSREGLTKPGKKGPVWTGEVRFSETQLQQVLRWRAPRMIFWNAHGDMFHESVPDEWIDRCFAAMAMTPQHTHQVLTKRSARMRAYLSDPAVALRVSYEGRAGWPLSNVWLGVSVEDQERADTRIPDLLATPAAVRWLSCEPLLGPVRLDRIVFPESHYEDWLRGDAWDDVNGLLNQEIWGAAQGPKLDWLVVGGESGHDARPMHPDWARSLRDQCATAGVPFLFKQWGNWRPSELCDLDCSARDILIFDETAKIWREAQDDGGWVGDQAMCRVGKKRAGRLLDGVQHDAFPEVAHG